MAIKDFRHWHDTKQVLHNEQARIFFKEREIWFCYLGENIGFEQDGRGNEFLRPVVVLKKFNNTIFWAVPLTKTEKLPHMYYFAFSFQASTASTAILSQLRLMDAKRLKYKSGTMTQTDFISIKTKIRQLLA